MSEPEGRGSLPAPPSEDRRAAAETAVEVLGGTPASIKREPVSPVRFVLPRGLSRRVGVFDRAVDRAFDERLRGRPLVDRVFYGASALGDYSLLWHIVNVARSLRSGARHERSGLRLVVALGVESLAVNWGVKSLFRRARPVADHDRPRPRPLRTPRTSSFPSGHATSGFMAATLLARPERPASVPLWFGVAGVVAASRVHVRIHHASDVVGGALIGLGFGVVVRRLWPLREGWGASRG